MLVLLPTDTKKLFARWQGPYKIVAKTGKVNYRVEMSGRRKPKRIFHVNMLRKYYSSEFVAFVQQPQRLRTLTSGRTIAGMTTGKELSVAQCGQVQTLIRKYSKVWSKVPGRTEKVAHSVETGSAHPIRQPTYRIPQAHKAEVVAKIEKMREAGVIVQSVELTNCPCTEERRSLRICIDYRKLNAVSQMDAYPMPRIDDLIEKLATSQHLIKDCLLLEFMVMPFGAPATFQRLMDSVVAGLSGLLGRCCHFQ